jgi:hypothetical protein
MAESLVVVKLLLLDLYGYVTCSFPFSRYTPLPLESGAGPNLLKQLGQTLPTPKAILVISAHWETSHPVVSAYAFDGKEAELCLT